MTALENDLQVFTEGTHLVGTLKEAPREWVLSGLGESQTNLPLNGYRRPQRHQCLLAHSAQDGLGWV